MPNHRSRGVLAVAGTVLLLALVTAGCGRRGLPAAAGVDDVAASGAAAGPTAAAAVEPSEPAPMATATATQAPEATEPPGASQPPSAGPQPTPAPLATPDFSAIDDLLADLDAALGADAIAESEEGSPE